MSDGGKIEKGKINYSINRGNKYNQMKNERELRYWKMNHVSAIVAKVGEEAFQSPVKIINSSILKNLVKLKIVQNH